MGLIIRFFSFLLVLGIAGLFFIKKPDGSPWLSLEQFKPDISVSAVKGVIDDVGPSQLAENKGDTVQVYRWKDTEGNWQYSDTPPSNINAEQVLVNTNLNRDLVPEFNASPKVEKTSGGGKAFLIRNGGTPSPTTVSPNNVGQLVEDAKNVQNLVNDRAKQLESLK